MPTLNLPKSIDDVVEPVLLDEDWYSMRLVKDPRTDANAVLKAYMKDRQIAIKPSNFDKALAQAISEKFTNEDGKFPGLNWVLSLRVVSDDPMIDGRGFTYWLQLPNSSDANRVNMQGQTIEDEKLTKIGQVLSAFGSDTSGEEVELEAGQMAQFYVTIGPDFRDPNKEANQIDLNEAPQPTE